MRFSSQRRDRYVVESREELAVAQIDRLASDQSSLLAES
jgi:hypothetical protein